MTDRTSQTDFGFDRLPEPTPQADRTKKARKAKKAKNPSPKKAINAKPIEKKARSQARGTSSKASVNAKAGNNTRLHQSSADFFNLALTYKALQFGHFTLKSGRISPYFFNMGHFNDGDCLQQLGHYYAKAIIDSQIQFDVLFGLAYKGIALVVATAMALSRQGHPVAYCFNRKEAKNHGEQGQLVGASLTGRRVLIIDDVITKGCASDEAMTIIQEQQAHVAGMVIALDRMEPGKSHDLAVREFEKTYRTRVISLATIDSLITFLEDTKQYQDYLPAIRVYREQYSGTSQN